MIFSFALKTLVMKKLVNVPPLLQTVMMAIPVLQTNVMKKPKLVYTMVVQTTTPVLLIAVLQALVFTIQILVMMVIPVL
jgi:hypothetical protein